MCTHENATVWLYEELATVYTLKGGNVSNTEDLEPSPQPRIDIDCPCGWGTTIYDVNEAPEPLRTYLKLIYKQEYGIGEESAKEGEPIP